MQPFAGRSVNANDEVPDLVELPMNRIVTAGATLFLLAGCGGGGESAQTRLAKVWPAEGIRQIRLTSVHSDIAVRASATNEIRLIAEARFEGRRAKERARSEFLKMSVDNGVLRIEEKGDTSRRRFMNFGSDDRFIEYSIEAPSSVALTLTNVSGEIDVAGVAAPAELHTVNGEIDVVARATTVEATSVNGPIDARFEQQFVGAKLRTVNGSVEVTVPSDSSFVCKISQVNGGFESNIPVQVRRRGSVDAVVGSGDPSKTLDVSTVNGDVSLLREDAPAVTGVSEQNAPPREPRPPVVMPELPPLPEFETAGGGAAPEPPAPPKPHAFAF